MGKQLPNEKVEPAQRELPGYWDWEPQAEATAQAGTQSCPSCGHPMPDLAGGRVSICPRCGYKESCCY